MAMKFRNDDGSIQGLALLMLTLIFGFALYEFLTLPVTDGVATSVTLFWATSTVVPDAAYTAGFENIAALNSNQVVAMLVMLFSAIAFLIVALRSKFAVN